MRHITSTLSGQHRAHDAEAAVFWILAGIIVVVAFADVIALFAGGVAIVALAWWISRTVERRAGRGDATTGSVTHLRPALAGHRGPKLASAHLSRHGGRAA